MKPAVVVLDVLYIGLIAMQTLYNLTHHGLTAGIVFGLFGTAILWGIPYLILRFALMGPRKPVQ